MLPIDLKHVDLAFEKRWRDLIKRLTERFDSGTLDLNATLFLIGVQELGQHAREFKKDEKVNLMHIAICVVLMPYGCLLYTSPSPRDRTRSRMPSSA